MKTVKYVCNTSCFSDFVLVPVVKRSKDVTGLLCRFSHPDTTQVHVFVNNHQAEIRGIYFLTLEIIGIEWRSSTMPSSLGCGDYYLLLFVPSSILQFYSCISNGCLIQQGTGFIVLTNFGIQVSYLGLLVEN